MFKVSVGNSKLGKIVNINLPALTTCPHNASCRKFCYANKGFYNMPSVKNRYAENLEAWENGNIVDLAKSLEAQIIKSKAEFVRWHSSGDIPDRDYIKLVHIMALMMPEHKFLIYTKRYNWINAHIKKYSAFADMEENLTIVFSVDDNLKMHNPYNLPVAVVSDTKTKCLNQINKSTCLECKRCWNLKTNDTMIFKKH